MEDHKALDPFAVYGGNWFHFKNCWVLVNRGTDSEFTHPFDLNEYEEYSEFRANKPEQWLYGFRLRFIGASEEDVKNQPDFFSDPNEAFTRTGSYRMSQDAKVYYYNGKHYVGIRVSGLDGVYNTSFFSSSDLKESIDSQFEIILKDPPMELPERGTPEYIQLYKESGATCIAHDENYDKEIGGNYVSEFDYIGYLKVTRTPEQYPKWLTDLLNKPSTAKLRKK